ncbi:unnamed protein product, partial [Ixodes persulcatus]
MPGPIGLGVHRQSKHKAAYNAEISVDRVKARWTPEESYLLAKMEVGLLRSGVKNINLALHSALQRYDSDKSASRTYDSVKCHRRMEAYRATVARLLAVAEDHPQQARSTPTESGTNVTEDGVPRVPQMRSRLRLLQEIRSLTGRQAPRTHGGAELWILARLALDGVEVPAPLNNYIREYFFRDVRPAPPHRGQQRRPQRRLSRRKQKKRDCALVQEQFRKRKSECAREILDGEAAAEVGDAEEFLKEWESIMAGPVPP